MPSILQYKIIQWGNSIKRHWNYNVIYYDEVWVMKVYLSQKYIITKYR